MEKATHSRFRIIFVFCRSSTANKEVFTKTAIQLGKELVSRDINLVCGGGSLGLMVAVAKTIYHGGCHILGISPKHLLPYIENSFGDLRVVEDMHARKVGMMEHADAFIAFLGGYGTIEELSKVLCWGQLGIHKKPVGVLNIDGFYDLFLLNADKMVDSAFLAPEHRALLISASILEELIKKMEENLNKKIRLHHACK